MNGSRWRSPPKFRSSLALLLLGSLVLSGILAYQAYQAARSHRVASESALRDYAAFASWELGQALSVQLTQLVYDAYDAHYAAGLHREDRRSSLSEYAEEVREEIADCGCPQAFPSMFSLDLRDDRLEVLGSTLPAPVHEWFSARMAVMVEANPPPLSIDAGPTRRSWPSGRDPDRADVRVQAGVPGAPHLSLLYSVVRGPGGQPQRVYGFIVHIPEFAAAYAREITATAPLLPPSLTGGRRNHDLLSIALSYGGGAPFFQLDGWFDPQTEVAETLRTPFGPIALRVAVRPEVANALVIGGLPRSRLPLLLGIFLLTLGLSVVAIVQLRREQELVRLRSRFIASVSHELRTPLAQIRLFSDLLRSNRLREEQRQRSVRVINEEAQRLTYLVENVLRFSRSEQSTDLVSPRPTHLGELVQEIVAGFAPLAAAAGTTLRPVVAPDTIARVDPDAFRQVLLNLLDNAVKYGPGEQIVTVALERDEGRIRLRVDDEGPGIPAAERDRIWEPYRRLQRDVEAATGGSGIGLAVVRELVELHGGEVGVQRSPSEGARFLVWLPAEPTGVRKGGARGPVEQGAGVEV